MKKCMLLSVIVLFCFSCSSEETAFKEEVLSVQAQHENPNIMLIIADDMGLDASPGYDIGEIKPHMPHLSDLMNNGIRFTNVWSNPTCTPTRAGILTGKFGFRTNVTKVGDELSSNEVSIQSYLDTKTAAAYAHAVIGKWHLSNALSHPNDAGINNFAGFLSGVVLSYWNWNLVENAESSRSSEYTTTKITDLAIEWVNTQDKPWFLWVAYNAPHTPFHVPPSDLHQQGNLANDEASINDNPLPYYLAMLEAMDTEFGRLLASMSDQEKDNTVFIFIGDNGSPNQVAQAYKFSQAKGSIYQGGINVPMIVSGKNVSRINEIEDALINTTDLFATIADIANTGTYSINDSYSFKSLFNSSGTGQRTYAFSERENDRGQRELTVRNKSHKYMVFGDGSEALYDMNNQYIEGTNLLNSSGNSSVDTENQIKTELINALQEIHK